MEDRFKLEREIMIKQIKEDIATLAENILNGEYCGRCKTPCNCDTDCYRQQTELHNALDILAKY